MTQHARTDGPHSDVPSAEPDAILDPHWQEMEGTSPLPAIYLPPAMPGGQRSWRKVVAVALCSVFVLATISGVCLTYGPSYFPW
jgi:hypothetical protein